MLLFTGLTIIVACLGYFYYTRVYLTKQSMEYYRRQFERAGYRVKFIPFRLYSFGVFDQLIQDQNKHRRPTYSLENHAQQWDVVVCSCFNIPMIEFYSADLIQAFYTTNINNYVKFEPFVCNFRRMVGNGMPFSDGEDWKKKRRIISSVFHFDLLNALLPQMNKMVDEKFQELNLSLQYQQKNPGGLIKFYLEIAGDVMMRLFFGGDNIRDNRLDGVGLSTFLNKLIHDVNAQGFQPPAVLFGMKFLELGLRAKDRDVNRRIRLFRSFAFDLIKRRVAELDEATTEGKAYHRTGDLIESLYLAKSLHDKTKTDDVYDYMELIEEFCTFFVAGTDTTSHLLTMICLYLEKNPAVKAKLMQEIDSRVSTNINITAEDLQSLHYLQAIIHQTGRMYGPGTAILARQIIKNHKIKQVAVKIGTIINVNFVPNNYNPLYYKNPFEFNPERWIDTKAAPHPFAFVPFSSGPRNCIGQHFAVMEAKLIMTKLMQNYDWHIERPEDVSFTIGFVTKPSQFVTLLRPKKPIPPV